MRRPAAVLSSAEGASKCTRALASIWPSSLPSSSRRHAQRTRARPGSSVAAQRPSRALASVRHVCALVVPSLPALTLTPQLLAQRTALLAEVIVVGDAVCGEAGHRHAPQRLPPKMRLPYPCARVHDSQPDASGA